MDPNIYTDSHRLLLVINQETHCGVVAAVATDYMHYQDGAVETRTTVAATIITTVIVIICSCPSRQSDPTKAMGHLPQQPY